jgi:hypothetical protein
MAKKTTTTEKKELSRVEWLKNSLSIGMSYTIGDTSEIDPKLAVELEDAGYLKIVEAASAPVVEAPESDTL